MPVEEESRPASGNDSQRATPSDPILRQRARGKNISKNESDWQQRSNAFTKDKSEEYMKFPMVTANELRGRKDRPRRVRMLMRDFIEGSWHIDLEIIVGFFLSSLPVLLTQPVQTVYTIRTTATSPSRSSSSPRASPSISPAWRASCSSTRCCRRGIPSLKTVWMRSSLSPQIPGSYGIPRRSYSGRTMARPSRGISSPTTASLRIPITT